MLLLTEMLYVTSTTFDRRPLPSYSHRRRSHEESHLGEAQWKQLGESPPPTGCHDFLSSSFLLHLFVVSPRSVFLPGSGNRLPHGWFPSWKCCENSISSLNGISAFGEISEQSAHAQRCQILQMLGSSDKTGIMWGSLLNPPTLMILTTSHTLKLLALA